MIERTPDMDNFLRMLVRESFGNDRDEMFKSHKCVRCGQDATVFDNAVSEKEYTISGLCQFCQDEIFNEEDE